MYVKQKIIACTYDRDTYVYTTLGIIVGSFGKEKLDSPNKFLIILIAESITFLSPKEQ